MKSVMHLVCVPEVHELDLYKEFHGWNMNSKINVMEYFEELQKMITRLHATDCEGQIDASLHYKSVPIHSGSALFNSYRYNALNLGQSTELKIKKSSSSPTSLSWTTIPSSTTATTNA